MKVIISPAKRMKVNPDLLPVKGMPQFMEETKLLCSCIQQLSYEEARALWQCNDKLAALNYERFAGMDLEKGLTPAILSYEGLQYQHMAPVVFSEEAVQYVETHLRILSGFYGVLAPFDGVVPYRLEMKARLLVQGKKDLYEFWGDKLYRKAFDEDCTIINLASKEYSSAIEAYLTPEDRFITVEFGELSGGKVKQKGTLAKMARGEMVRYMAENNITDVEGLKAFSGLGYQYSDEWSGQNRLVFLLV